MIKDKDIKGIVDELELKIKECTDKDGDVSWGMQEGILISKGFAKKIKKCIDFLVGRKKVQYKAYCERSAGWGECIVVYDDKGKEVARSNNHHPEGVKAFYWKGYEFMAMSYKGEPRTECYVKLTDKVFLEEPGE